MPQRAACGHGHQQALRRPAGADRCRVHDQARRNLRADRPQRRRQDHAVQRADRHLRPDGGEFMFDGEPLVEPEAQRRRRARHRAHVPEHPAVRQPDRAGERDGRPPRAHARRRLGRDLAQRRRRAPRRARDPQARARAARLRRRREARQQPRQAPGLRRPAPAGDRARARDRAEAAGARRARGRHERHRDRVAQAPARATSAATARRSC